MYRHCDGIEFLKSLPDSSVDGIFTDPPWGYAAKGKRHKRSKAIETLPGQDKWLKLLDAMSQECPRILKPGARVLIWLGVRSIVDAAIVLSRHLEYRWSIYVSYMPPRFVANFYSHIDQILYFARAPEDPWPKSYNGKKLSQVFFKASKGKRDTAHPCARPITTVSQIIDGWFAPGEYVIDPFAGSDTTGRACRELGVISDTCEIVIKLFQTGIERHRQGILWE